jgi:guanylate kinase
MKSDELKRRFEPRLSSNESHTQDRIDRFRIDVIKRSTRDETIVADEIQRLDKELRHLQ